MLKEAVTLAEQGICRHHWVIQPANGPVSLGVCRFCLEVREFRNFIEQDWMRNWAEDGDAFDGKDLLGSDD